MFKKAMLFALAALMPLLYPAAPFASPPDQCLIEISDSIESGDAAAFEKLVDMDQILNSAFGTFLSEIQKPENSSNIAPMLAILLNQMQSGEQAIKNMLIQEAKAFVLNGVGSGAFAGKQLSSKQTQGLLAPLFANASLGRKEIRGMGEPLKDESGWLLPFTVHDYGNGNDYPVIGRFEETDEGTRLVNIENLDQIMQQIKKEAE